MRSHGGCARRAGTGTQRLLGTSWTATQAPQWCGRRMRREGDGRARRTSKAARARASFLRRASRFCCSRDLTRSMDAWRQPCMSGWCMCPCAPSDQSDSAVTA